MTLKLFSSTRNELQTLNDKTLEVERKMVTDQHRFLLGFSGLEPFLEALHNRIEDVHSPIDVSGLLNASLLFLEIHSSRSRISNDYRELSRISSPTP